MRELRARRRKHPWWGGVGDSLELFSFDRYEQFRSTGVPGNETEWPNISMRLSTIEHHRYIVGYNAGRHVTHVLDVAAGTGVYASHLAWTNSQLEPKDRWQLVAGVSSPAERDAVQTAIEQLGAEAFVKSIQLLDPRRMEPLADTSFDIVYALGPFYELTDETEIDAVALEMARVLKPGGHAIASFKLRHAAVARAVALAGASLTTDDLMHLAIFNNPGQYGPIETPPQLEPHHYVDVEEIRELFTYAGLEEVELVAVSPLMSWLATTVWARIRDLDERAFRVLETMDDHVGEDAAMQGMSLEVLFVGKKPV